MAFCDRLPDLNLPGSTARNETVADVMRRLGEFASRSNVGLRGSLADGSPDVYSDIDLLWEVEDASFLTAVDGLREVLESVRPIRSFRTDPDYWNTPRHRLIFIRFADLPLFWRIDLEVFARSAHRDPDCDGRATAPPEDWSPAESALNNAIAAVKACKRGNSIQARQLLERAFLRLLLPWSGLTARDAILHLVGYARAVEPTLIPLADDVERLAL